MDKYTMVHPDNKTFFKGLKRNELSNYKEIWSKKYILLSRRSQYEKATYYMISAI